MVLKAVSKPTLEKNGYAVHVECKVAIMRQLRHPHTISLYEVLATRTKIYFVMEFAVRGELFHVVAVEAVYHHQKYFWQLLSSMRHCPSHGVYHRDLKLDNIHFDQDMNLNVSDFGLSALRSRIQHDGMLHNLCGTPAYVAPEILARKGYDGAIMDVWSCDIVLFVLNAGYLPFNDYNVTILYRKIKNLVTRRCFPCWDEPACKDTFKITLDLPSELVALSNMPIVEEIIDGDLKIVSYQESPIMSTYLVAVVVGLFDYVEDHTSDGVKVRGYFATPYSLPKLDMIAIPDFAAGAIENYGLVTYRETALLYGDQHSAAANKQRVATVVAHELAHHWFGNLVAMEWWTHLWLNEGFATWVSYLATDSCFLEWKIWSKFLHESTEGLSLDGLAESHPIEVEINHACEIDEIFDAISYRKGAYVIRMLQSYLGVECFQRSLASYIKRHACSNAKTEDL
ncbi:Aminopeptidase M1 [Glycine max]|nr:Aminopeptidase M1 [Glycine max]